MTDKEWRDAWQSGRTLHIAHGAKLSFYEVATMGPERLAKTESYIRDMWQEFFRGYGGLITPVAETQQAPVTPNPAAMCRCGHRRQFHEGRKRLLCLIAGCPCNDFALSDES